MDEAGQRNFSRALAVAKQVFNSLTEYIQVSVMHNTGGWQVIFFFLNVFLLKALCVLVSRDRALATSRVSLTAGCGMLWLGSFMFLPTCR